MTEDLVLMQKDGEQLEVHPTTVEAHKAAGWKVVESEEPAADENTGGKGKKKKKGSEEPAAEEEQAA